MGHAGIWAAFGHPVGIVMGSGVTESISGKRSGWERLWSHQQWTGGRAMRLSPEHCSFYPSGKRAGTGQGEREAAATEVGGDLEVLEFLKPRKPAPEGRRREHLSQVLLEGHVR